MPRIESEENGYGEEEADERDSLVDDIAPKKKKSASKGGATGRYQKKYKGL